MAQSIQPSASVSGATIKARAASVAVTGCQCGGKRRPQGPAKCHSVTVSDPIKKPDLAIYSQVEQLQSGGIPSWDSPDIITNEWRPFRLLPEARVTVRNLSPSVPAVNALVHYFISPFGIGTHRELKLTKVVNVAPGGAVTLMFPLDPTTLAGDPRVGVHIVLEHPHDAVAVNDAGSQVHDGAYTTESGRSFAVQIPVYNDSNLAREIRLSIMPTDLIASVSPAVHLFGAHEQIIATLNIQVPSFLAGTPAAVINRGVTVVGRLPTGELIGGATRLLRIDS